MAEEALHGVHERFCQGLRTLQRDDEAALGRIPNTFRLMPIPSSEANVEPPPPFPLVDQVR